MNTPRVVFTACILCSIFLNSVSLAGSRQITGKVLDHNKKDKRLIVQGKKDILTIYAADTTKVIAEEFRDIADVKVGDRVTIRYREKDKVNAAKQITIRAVPREKFPR